MEKDKEDQDIRAKFYTDPLVARYIRAHGVPKSKHTFKDMVASGTSEKLDTGKGLELVDCLRYVVFSTHPQQINVMDKSSVKTIASLRRS